MNKYVAICGAPGVGKTTVAEILVNNYGALIIDDGATLRKSLMTMFNLTWEQVYTPKGKAEYHTICGKQHQTRKMLGDLGNWMESYFGDQVLPELALKQVRFNKGNLFVFPSVRKNQGLTYRNAGGIVLEITRQGYLPVNDFDYYDKSYITHTISNDGSIEDLEERIKLFDNECSLS